MECLLTETLSPGVVHIKLNRPLQHNSMNDALMDVLMTTLENLAHDDSLRVLVLSGEGKSFCAGVDLNSMEKAALYDFQENLSHASRLAHLMKMLDEFPKPTIALVQGATLGGGIGLVCCCDLVIAAENAWFCFSEVKIGLIPAVISPYVIAAIGPRNARRYFLTAEKIDASKAREIGLVHEIAGQDLLAAAESIIQMILKNGPEALTEAKQLVELVSKQPLDESLRQQTASLIAERRASVEGIEGIRSFLEKRAPKWQQ